MESIIKNITGLVLVIAIAVLGYYLYNLSTGGSQSYLSQNQLNVLAETAIFLERKGMLDRATLDTTVLDNSRFRSLVSHSTPLNRPTTGRQNPFDRVQTTPNRNQGDLIE